MDNIIKFKELECYKLATEKQKCSRLYAPEYKFDLSKLPTYGLKREFREYIVKRGIELSPLSMHYELWPYNRISCFLMERRPFMQSLLEEAYEEIVHDLKVWMTKNKYPFVYKKFDKSIGRYEVDTSEILRYLKKIYNYLEEAKQQGIPEEEKDIWKLEKLGFPVQNNFTNPVNSLSFLCFRQAEMKKEAKKVALHILRYLSARTVQGYLSAAKRMSVFFAEKYPEIDSFLQIDREILEEYLIYISTEVKGKKNFSSELSGLKQFLSILGKIYEYSELEEIFFDNDIPSRGMPIYKSYSDNEMVRLNRAIAELNEQVARALILHEMMGNRISETLSLKRDCIVKRNGHMMVRIFQLKTQRLCYKPVSDEAVALIRKSIAYTKKHYGDTEYVFCYDKAPAFPMKYGRIQYQLMVMIQERQLKDDNGALFGVGTHLFRHTFGRKLAEMNVDDVTIAKLLGHKGTSSVKYYRKVGNEKLLQQTKELMEQKSDIIELIAREW